MYSTNHEMVMSLNEERPRYPVGLLSNHQKDRLIERGTLGLYRIYTADLQKRRNWHPDTSFEWQTLRTNHSPELNRLVEGFFAVEQYIPDYTSKGTNLVRKSHGRSHFRIRWGAEEEKHADTWLNVILFLKYRSPKWIENYRHILRNDEWNLPWDDPLHIVLYSLIQERATQLNYLSTKLIVEGKSDLPEFANPKDIDPMLAKVAGTIAVDEAAHYSFFLNIVRLHLYYYPTKTIEALVEVLNNFTMPAMELLPDEKFYDFTLRSEFFTPRKYAQDVVKVAFKALGIKDRKAIVNGVKESRRVPDPDGNMRDTSIFDGLDYSVTEANVKRLFCRIEEYEKEVGFSDIDPTCFLPTGIVQD